MKKLNSLVSRVTFSYEQLTPPVYHCGLQCGLSPGEVCLVKMIKMTDYSV